MYSEATIYLKDGHTAKVNGIKEVSSDDMETGERHLVCTDHQGTTIAVFKWVDVTGYTLHRGGGGPAVA